MPDSPLEVLKRYWGYDSFRQLQPEIIDSILQGHDTIGLLPTGGGKSITFQVPALMLPGLTVVVTPLISLMKDQVDNLRSLDIKACAIHSGLTRAEQKLAMDRCRLGHSKLLYLSPEKLQSANFIQQLEQMNVSLIVVDEAHCISQWGYDFRPSYLRIASLRRVFPKVPVLALTASATPEVTDDIARQLNMRNHRFFARSFSRHNISFLVRQSQHKPDTILKILRATSGSAIVYVRSRRRTREYAEMLKAEGISADYYHAGLSAPDKNQKQNDWKTDKTRVMVATNAFGMGIDKPDVRTVIHADIPSSLEEYYQEAGRAGRDGKPSYAVIVTSGAPDKATLSRRLTDSFPPKDTLRTIYDHLCNFLGIAVGDGYNTLHEFKFQLFCDRFGYKPPIVKSALSLLTRAGYIEYVEEVSSRSRVIILMNKHELYDLRLDDLTDRVFQILLRSYTGLFADYVHISEELIASRAGATPQQVYDSMLTLARMHVIHYVPRKTTPYVFFPTSRELSKHLIFPRAIYEDMRRRMQRRIDAMKRFVFDTGACRVDGMLEYFGQVSDGPCGKCDYCRADRPTPQRLSPEQIRQSILYIASQPRRVDINYLSAQLSLPAEKIIPILRDMADSGEISIGLDMRIMRV